MGKTQSRKELIKSEIESVQARIWWLLTRQQQLLGQDTAWAERMFERNENELARARRKLAHLLREYALA